jgi:tetratricopeptide (TPR) repeat protein
MDLITKSLINALNKGLHDSQPEPDQEKTKLAAHGYHDLKTALSRKFGAASDLLEAIEQLEKKPGSTGRQEVLKEEIAAVRADQDAELRALARTLLDQLEAKSGVQQPASPIIPLQRPPRANYFSGREAELSQLLARLRPGVVVGLHGPGGIGKSALAAAAVWTLAPQHQSPDAFPDGIVYYNFYTQPRVDMALARIARAFGEEPIPTAYEAGQRALAGRQALLLLDEVEHADDLAGLLASRGQCGVLMTRRQPQEIPELAITWQAVPPLSLERAISLLAMWSNGQHLAEATAEQICELVSCSPLAVRLIGHYLATTQASAQEYLTWLAQTPLAEMTPAQRQSDGAAVVIEHSLAQVSEMALQILGIAGLLAPLPFDERAITRALTIKPQPGLLSTIKSIFRQQSEVKKPDIRPALQSLVNYGLLRWVGQHPEVPHSMLHTYARQHLAPSDEVVRQVTTYYTALAWRQSALGAEGYERLDAERPHLLKILGESLERKDWEAAHGLAAAIEDYLDRQGHLVERVIANEAGLIAAWQLGHPSEGAWLGNLGDTYRTMGHAKWAIEHFKKALDTARQEGDPYGQGNSLGNLGLAYRDLGQIEQAREYLKQSQAIFERINSPSAELVREWLRELDTLEE